MILLYWMEKYFILNHCSKAVSMNYFPKKVLFGALILHLTMSLWFFSCPGLFYPDEEDPESSGQLSFKKLWQ
jgi:hypothetical protein